MKTVIISVLLLSVSLGSIARGMTVPTAAPASDEALLAAIAAVETGNHSERLGRKGERTQLQILPATWRAYSRLPHAAAAAHPAETERVARAYLAHIRERLRTRGLPETPFFIAAGWNAGPDWRRLHASTVAYAERVANLVEASQPKTTAMQMPKSAPLPASVPMIGATEAGPSVALKLTLPTPVLRVAAN